jgi:hypothetical protein
MGGALEYCLVSTRMGVFTGAEGAVAVLLEGEAPGWKNNDQDTKIRTSMITEITTILVVLS